MTQAERIILAKYQLFNLYKTYSSGKGFNLDKYHALEKTIDDIFDGEVGEKRNRWYPNPCGEIALGVTCEED